MVKKDRNEIKELYESADIYFLPSVSEGLANAVLEEYRGRTTDYYIGAVTMLSVMALQIAVGTSKEILSATLIKLTEKCIERYNEAANTEEMLQRDEV